MDAISMGKAGAALNKIKDLDQNIVAPLAESRFPTVDARLDWLEAQAGKIKATGSKQLDLSQGVFVNTEQSAGKLQLKVVASTGSGYTSDLCAGGTPISGGDHVVTGAGSASYAFDNTDAAWWSLQNTNHKGVSWIGYKFSTPKHIRRITSKSHAADYNTVPQILIQRSDDGTNWTTVLAAANAFNTTNTFDLPSSQSSLYWRIMADGAIPSTDAFWIVLEIDMMESAVQNQYTSQGTWESPIIDLGEGWIDTKLAEVVKNISGTGVSLTIETATSVNGVTFSSYAALDPASPPDARYIKIKVSLSATAGTTTTTSLDFNQSDAQNTFTLDSYTVADGTLRMKNSFTSAMVNEGSAGTGILFSTVIDKSSFKSIEKVTVV